MEHKCVQIMHFSLKIINLRLSLSHSCKKQNIIKCKGHDNINCPQSMLHRFVIHLQNYIHGIGCMFTDTENGV